MPKCIVEKPTPISRLQTREIISRKNREIELESYFIFIKLNGTYLLKVRQELHLWCYNHAVEF